MKKITLLGLLLTFLSGTFSLNRLNMGISIEIRYVLFSGFILALLVIISQRKSNNFLENRLNSSLIVFLLATFIYIFFALISFFYNLDQVIALEKMATLIFLIFLVISVVVMVSCLKLHEFFSIISIFFILVGILYALPIYLSVISGAYRGDVNFSGPNVTTRILFFASCSSIYRFFLNKKAIYFILTILFLFSIVLVGSRGGLVGAVLILFLLFTIKKISIIKKEKMKFNISLKNILYVLVGLVTVFFIYKPVKRVFMERVVGTTFSDNGIYTAGRDIIYADAIKMIKEKPIFGYGIDSFSVYTGHVYPHNLFLEMMVEVGIIGAIFFAIFVFFSIMILFKMIKSPLFIFSGLPLYMIIVQMFSGEFYDFRYYFLWMIPLLNYGIQLAYKTKSISLNMD